MAPKRKLSKAKPAKSAASSSSSSSAAPAAASLSSVSGRPSSTGSWVVDDHVTAMDTAVGTATAASLASTSTSASASPSPSPSPSPSQSPPEALSRSTSPVPSASATSSPAPSPQLKAVPLTFDTAATEGFHINPPPTDRPVRLYCDGIWDLFHLGHARALEQAKKRFPNTHLIVGVCNDALTHAKKGKTVMNQVERAESLRHCRWVDEVIEDAPWVIDRAFLDAHAIDYVAHDDLPYVSADSEDIYQFVKDAGQFVTTRRTNGVSTSELITRIVRDYEAYIRRNLSRGVSRKDLNVSYIKAQEIRMKSHVQRLLKTVQNNLLTPPGREDVWRGVIDFLDEAREDFSRGFVSLFTRADGRPRLFSRISSGISIASSPPASPRPTDVFDDAISEYASSTSAPASAAATLGSAAPRSATPSAVSTSASQAPAINLHLPAPKSKKMRVV